MNKGLTKYQMEFVSSILLKTTKQQNNGAKLDKFQVIFSLYWLKCFCPPAINVSFGCFQFNGDNRVHGLLIKTEYNGCAF